MIWNAARPADSDRIRLSATLLRDNFQAIETGTVPYDALSLEAQGSISPVANQNRIYSYLNGDSGQVELASLNPAGNVVRLTEGGRLGSLNQNAVFSGVRFTAFAFEDVNAYQYTAANMIIARGSVAANGTATMTVNLSATKTNTGTYTLTIPAGILRVNSYQVLLTAIYNVNEDTIIANISQKPSVNIASPTVITVEMVYRTDGGPRRDSPFEVVIVGGR